MGRRPGPGRDLGRPPGGLLTPALALWGLLSAAAPGAAPLWLTLDVANPEVLGRHRLLHLEDVVGPDRRDDIPGLPAADAVVLFSARPADCASAAATAGPAPGLCALVAERLAALRARKVLFVAVILATREEAASTLAALRRAELPFVVTFDVHGLARQALDLDGPGRFVVINSEGLNIEVPTPSKADDTVQVARQLEQVRMTVLAALGRDEEDRP